MADIFIFNHGGSENHGCEALVRTVSTLIGEQSKRLYSDAPEQDFKYKINQTVDVMPAKYPVSKTSIDFLKAYMQLKLKKDYFQMDILPYRKTIRELQKEDVEVSVGGDIYCYEDYPKFIEIHKLIHQRGCKSILLGCSLEEKLFSDPRFTEDMKSYDLISARETLTYDLLKKAGIQNVVYHPDSAFLLETEKLPLPKEFVEGNTVGLNVSPLVVRKEKKAGIVYRNYENLIHYILKHTDASIALIPHVVWKDNDDRTVLKKLYEEFQETGRVCLIQDCNAMQLKGYISRCRFFIGARTHATIAAYSSCVPTLVLGYSIKSKGIAKDLFGSYENYVIPVEQINNENTMVEAFQWLTANESQIQSTLTQVIPEYVEAAKSAEESIKAVSH